MIGKDLENLFNELNAEEIEDSMIFLNEEFNKVSGFTAFKNWIRKVFNIKNNDFY